MFERFYPDMFAGSIYEIDLDGLYKRGIRGVILDIDNTLVPAHAGDATDDVRNWLGKVKDAGLKACIVSNASRKRVEHFCSRLDVFAVHRAAKPMPAAFLKAADHMGTCPETTAVVGDQVFTDVVGGKRLGMYSILVKPISGREFFLVGIKRILERLVFRSYRRKYGKKDGGI